MDAANHINSLRVFVRVQDVAVVMGLSISHVGNYFRELKKEANINTQGVHIDTFFQYSPKFKHLKDIKREEILKVLQ